MIYLKVKFQITLEYLIFNMLYLARYIIIFLLNARTDVLYKIE